MPTPFLSSEEYDERAHQLYNEGQYDEALDVLREGLGLYPNSVELHIGVGYAHHAREDYAWARRSFEEALVLDPDHEDALAGLGETLLKFGQQDAALRSFRHTLELGYQDDVELKMMSYRLRDNDPELRPWEDRLRDLSGELDDIDEMLAEIEAKHMDAAQTEAKGQLELFGALLSSFADIKTTPESHRIKLDDGNTFEGTWEEIVDKMRDANCLKESPKPEQDAESFIRRSADAGLLRILR